MCYGMHACVRRGPTLIRTLTLALALTHTHTITLTLIHTLTLALASPLPSCEPGFNQAVAANSAVRLMMQQRDWDNVHLVDQLVIVGRVLGVLNIEKCAARTARHSLHLTSEPTSAVSDPWWGPCFH